MIKNQKHIINKVFLEVNTSNNKTAYKLKDNLSIFLKQDILPYLEQYFISIEDKLPSEIVQIPKLNLNLTVSSKNNFEELKQTIKEQFVTKIQQRLIVTNSTRKDITFISKQESNLKTFFYFLEEGILPWNSIITARNNIFNKKELLKIVKTNEFTSFFQQKISKTSVQNRLLNQFDAKEIQLILQQGFKDSVLEIIILNENLVTEIDKLNNQNKKLIWQLIIKYFSNKNIPLFTNALTKITNTVEKNKKNTKTEVKQVKKVIAILYKNKQINKENTNSNFFNETQNKDRIQETDKEQFENKNLDKSKKIIQPNIDEIEVGYHVKVSKVKSEDVLKEFKNNKTKLSKENKLLNKNEIINTNKEQFENKNLDKSKKNIHPNIDEIEDYHKVKMSKVKSEDVLLKELKNNKTKRSKENKLLNKNEIINTKDFLQEDKANYYIENAGLILLHPFLKQFFKTCKLLDKENNIIDIELAVHLLHYTATKKEKQLESNLVFEKFLCGVPIKQSINRNTIISKKLKKQSEELLKSVIQNWEILKNASTDLLRNEFLQRAGKLSLKGDSPKINIERKTQDILLDKLPWNIGISKLPWLDKLIFTDW